MNNNTIPESKKKLALFDFDGTITTHDSYIEFLQTAVSKGRLAFGMLCLLPIMIGYGIGLVSAQQTKEKMIGHFFKGMAEEKFADLATRFALGKMLSMVKPSALERIKWHKEQGHDIVVVSASISYWLLPWCQKHELELIATELEVKDNCITGKLASPNCKNAEKVKRIQARYHLEDYDYIYAYAREKCV